MEISLTMDDILDHLKVLGFIAIFVIGFPLINKIREKIGKW